jgi:hypothetical protein
MKHDNGKQENVMAISIVGLSVWLYWDLANVYSRCILRTREYEVVLPSVIKRFSVNSQFKKCHFNDKIKIRYHGGGEFV